MSADIHEHIFGPEDTVEALRATIERLTKENERLKMELAGMIGQRNTEWFLREAAVAELAKAREENERFRAALTKIAGRNYRSASQCNIIARAALPATPEPQTYDANKHGPARAWPALPDDEHQ